LELRPAPNILRRGVKFAFEARKIHGETVECSLCTAATLAGLEEEVDVGSKSVVERLRRRRRETEVITIVDEVGDSRLVFGNGAGSICSVDEFRHERGVKARRPGWRRNQSTLNRVACPQQGDEP
jgi:hypothetical protein